MSTLNRYYSTKSLSPFYRWGNWGLWWLNNLSAVTWKDAELSWSISCLSPRIFVRHHISSQGRMPNIFWSLFWMLQSLKIVNCLCSRNLLLDIYLKEIIRDVHKDSTLGRWGASLLALWERIYLPIQETQVSPWSGKTPHAKEQLSPGATTIGSVL